MNIFLTGCAGFIGSHLCESLLNSNNQITGIDNFDTFYSRKLKESNISILNKYPGFSLIEGDFTDLDLVNKIFDSHKFDLIIHLGALAGVRPSLIDPLRYQKVNIMGTQNIIEAIKNSRFKPSKFIFASSSSVYGNNKKVPFSEDDRVDNPISYYAATKKSGEEILFTFHHLTKIPVTCLRFFTVYGPRQRPEMAIHHFTRNIFEENPVRLFGDGNTRRDYTYIDDIVHGIIRSIENCKGYEIFNLGESQTTTLNELISLIEESIGKKAIRTYEEMKPGDVEQTFADISKAKRLLGYDPKTKIKDGIKKFIEWFKKQNNY